MDTFSVLSLTQDLYLDIIALNETDVLGTFGEFLLYKRLDEGNQDAN